MNDVGVFFDNNLRLKSFFLVPLTPIRDPLQLMGSKVTAPSETDAWRYLSEAGGWFRAKELTSLKCDYQLVLDAQVVPSFRGSKSEWIQAVWLGYMPPPVRFSEDAQTQDKIDKKETHEYELHCQMIQKMSRPNFWKRFSYWLEQQRYHPVRWKLVGFLALGTLAAIYWVQILSIGAVVLAMLFFFRYLRGY